MFYVYLLKSKKTGEIYIGFTSDLQNRFLSHNSKENKSTKSAAPWNLVYYEAYSQRKYALDREKKLKQYKKGLGILKKRIGL